MNQNNVPSNQFVQTPNTADNQVVPSMEQATQNTADVKSNGKNSKLKGFKYTVINSAGKKEMGSIDTETEQEARSFLIAQDFKILELKERSAYDIDIDSKKFSSGDLSFSLTQLSTYIKSGIPLADSIRILSKQATKPAHKKVFNQLVYELLRGESFSSALAKQGKVFPPLLINMVKTAELTGDLPSILDDQAEYYTSMEKTRKQMVSAMTYPAVILLLAVGVLVFMLVYLVPQFASMFESNDAKLPAITTMVMGASDFIQQNYLILIIVVLSIVFIFIYLYKKVTSFRKGVQYILMHLPVVSKVIIYNEVANFTKTFASLLNHGVFITDSMEILSKITNNEIYKGIIANTLTNLAKGESVSTAFRGQWAVPVVAYEMIVTGESTGRLGDMMEKVADHFQNLHKSIIDQMKSLIEPLMICVLAGIVGIILLSIIQPMFSIYDQVK